MEIGENWDDEFRRRIEKHFDEMKWLYAELYHNDQHAFEYFCNMLYSYYSERKPLLREWDDAKTTVDDWYKGNDIIGMMMYTENFGGTLQGVKDHLDYIIESGVNYLHLMPILKSPEGKSDGGYSVSDFRSVQPELGTMEDLSDLADACHEHGISLCLDFVMNHTSDEHEWARAAKAGNKEAQDRYFFFDDWTIPNQFEQTVPEVFPETAPGNFSWCSEAGKVVMTTFHPYQWDLNYANPTVFNDMTANMLNLCNHGVDVIRIDAVPYIWKQLGTSCRNLPRVHTLVRLMRMAVEIVCPGTLLLGEIVMKPEEVAPYFGTVDKSECHMVYNAPIMATTWHTVATQDVRLMRHQLEIMASLPKDFLYLDYLRCHDDIGWGLDYDYLKQFGIEQIPHKNFLNNFLRGHWEGSDARGELYNDDPLRGDARLCGTTASLCGIEAAEYEGNDWKLNRAETLDIMLHAFLFSQSGIPVIYSGDEIGQKNDYTYHDDPLKRDDSRYLHRGKFPWDEAALRNDPNTRPGRIFQSLRKMEKIRSEHPVFESKADVWCLEPYNDHILGIGRYYKGEKLIALFNFGSADETAWINEPEDYIDLMTGKPREAKAVGVPARDFAWLLTDFNKAEKARRAEKAKKAAKTEINAKAQKTSPEKKTVKKRRMKRQVSRKK